MSFFRGDFFSEELGMQTGIHVIIPDAAKNSDLRVLYLLHGLSDNCSNWIRNTSIERYAVEYNTAVIIPEVQRSFYTDMKYGLNYFSYVADELPRYVHKMFGLSNSREKTFVAGLSMGGYGALKCALTYPKRYGCCAAFSSACDIVKRVQPEDLGSAWAGEVKAVFGEDLKVPARDNLHLLARKSAKSAVRPRFFITCGTQDGLLSESWEMSELMTSLNYDIRYEEWEGNHTWEFWDTSIRKAFAYFFGSRENGVKTPLSDGK